MDWLDEAALASGMTRGVQCVGPPGAPLAEVLTVCSAYPFTIGGPGFRPALASPSEFQPNCTAERKAYCFPAQRNCLPTPSRGGEPLTLLLCSWMSWR